MPLYVLVLRCKVVAPTPFTHLPSTAILLYLSAADDGKRASSAKTALLAVVHQCLGTLPLEYTYAQHGAREEEAAAVAGNGAVEQLAVNGMLQQPAAGMVAGMPILPGLQPAPILPGLQPAPIKL